MRVGVLVLGVSLFASTAHAQATTTDVSAATTSAATTTEPVRTNEGVEQKVRAYFADVPAMIEIARCESRFRQYDGAGGALRGGLGGGMVGLFQVYDKIHRGAASAMGHDIDTPEGNMGYARHLYESQGTDPWLSSFACWGSGTSAEALPPVAAAVQAGGVVTLTKNLSLGVIDPEVRFLQQLLNRNGYRVTDSGPGAPGQETDKYGALTRDAVRSFQCKQGIVCTGSEGTTGYGYVGARTRAALLSLGGSVEVTTISANPAVSAAPATGADDTATKIAQLQAQIAQLLAIIAQLQASKTVVAVAQ